MRNFYIKFVARDELFTSILFYFYQSNEVVTKKKLVCCDRVYRKCPNTLRVPQTPSS